MSDLLPSPLVEGLDALSDEHLVALLLGGRKAPRLRLSTARRLLDHTGGLPGLARAGVGALRAVHGVAPDAAARLTAAFELATRARCRALADRFPVPSPEQVAALMTERIGELLHEEMWLLSLDGQATLRSARRLAQGGLHGCAITARDVLRAALADGASGFVLCHNHPSGSPEPSAEDWALTRIVAEAADLVGIPLLDHLIVTAHGEYSSFVELGGLAGPSS